MIQIMLMPGSCLRINSLLTCNSNTLVLRQVEAAGTCFPVQHRFHAGTCNQQCIHWKVISLLPSMAQNGSNRNDPASARSG
jgi:hypothetical protein